MATRFGAEQRRWEPTQWRGVEVARAGDDVRSGASMFRMRAGAVIAAHDHPLGEHTYIVQGQAQFGSIHARAGDMLYTRPGEVHEVRALTDVVFVGMAPR